MELTAERWQQVRHLFEQALQLEPAQRNRFVITACGDDDELRQELESLLAHDAAAVQQPLRPPTLIAAARARAHEDHAADHGLSDPRIGNHLDGFKVLRIIGRGGMGTVYEAEQSHPHRSVALKVLNHRVLTPALRRRFLYEVEMLGRLEHPNIARIYSAGVDGDPACAAPYFAMELVRDSRPITEYADAVGLDARARVALFIKVCDAVHHGHQKGVIHRDLKPGNILVGADAVPKVIDFGVARATDADIATTTMETAAGTIIGTVQYMSPEQCDADPRGIDTRSDVYSLGVILYELLTGRPPYDLSGKTITAALRTIQDAVPAPLAAGNRRLRGDIETIVAKALHKSRAERYPSAADLAQDMQRFLNREPIEARAATPWTNVVRWIARHPLLTTAAACAVMAAGVVGGTIAATWYARSLPARIWVAPDRSSAQVENSFGEILRRWYGETRDLVLLAEFVKVPAEFGGGEYILVATKEMKEPIDGYQLAFYDTHGDLSRPVRRLAIEPDAKLPDPHGRGFSASHFVIQQAMLADVFPEVPGKEIVAVYMGGGYTQSIIRVYDLSGAVRYQIWHDAAIYSMYWVAEWRQLCLAGENGEASWAERGRSGTARTYPRVVFAIRPRLDVVLEDYLRTTPGKSELDPVWYGCQWPPESADQFCEVLVIAPREFERGGVKLSWISEIGGVEASLWWTVDESGREIPGARECTETYKANLLRYPKGDPKRLPEVDSFTLASLSPISHADSQPSR